MLLGWGQGPHLGGLHTPGAECIMGAIVCVREEVVWLPRWWCRWPCLFQVSWPTSWSPSSGNGPASRDTAPCLRACSAISRTTKPSGRACCPNSTEAAAMAARTTEAQGPRPRSRLWPKATPPSARGRRAAPHADWQPPRAEASGRADAVGLLLINAAPPWTSPRSSSESTLLPLTCLLPFPKCTEAFRHLSISCRNEQLHSTMREPTPGTGLALEETTGEYWKRCSCRGPSGPGSHCDGRRFLSPEHFSLGHRTAELHDKNTSIFGTPRTLVLSARALARESVRESTFYFNNNYYYKIIINLFNFSILCTRQWI